MSFDSLPNEVVLQIFSLFSLEQLQTNLRLVNSRWKRLADDDSHYRKLILKSNITSPIAIHLLQKYCKKVKYLQLLERTDVNSLAPYIKECSNLKSLTLTLCYGNGEDLTQALKYCYRLETLIIHHCECLDDISNLLAAVSGPSMKKINIRNVQTYRDIYLCSLRNIEDLRLKSVYINFISLCRFCQNNRESLTTFKLIPSNENYPRPYYLWAEEINGLFGEEADVPQRYITWMMRFIGESPHLRSLCLGPLVANELNDDLLIHLNSLNSLSTLVLYQANSITEIGFTKLFQQPLAKNLTKIGLHQCLWITSFVLRTIATNCKNLEKFIFEKCKHTQTNQDHEDILMVAKNCKKLKKMHLFGMDICVAHVLHLLPEYLPQLQSLEYNNDSAPMDVPSFLLKLQEKMPEFNVSGLQWKFNLHVNCKRKTKWGKFPKVEVEYVCAMDLKTHANFV